MLAPPRLPSLHFYSYAFFTVLAHIEAEIIPSYGCLPPGDLLALHLWRGSFPLEHEQSQVHPPRHLRTSS